MSSQKTTAARTIIKADEKFATISKGAQMRDVASKLAKAIYGKGIHDCLGTAQNVCKKARETKFTVYAFPLGLKETGWVHSIIKHAQSHGVDINVVLV